MDKVSIFWFRRDLRLDDNHGLNQALQGSLPVQPIFIFDTDILSELPHKDARVEFIYKQILNLQQIIGSKGGYLDVRYGKPIVVWKDILEEYQVEKVFANKDYEPYARHRDKEVYDLLQKSNIRFSAYKDHVLFEKSEVLKKDGTPYAVFTPYSRLWKSRVDDDTFKTYPSDNSDHWHQGEPRQILSLKDMGFEPSDIEFPSSDIREDIIDNYHLQRDVPAKSGTTRLSVHLRFGTVSIRRLAKTAMQLNEKFLNELIWRDFYACILWHFPEVVDSNFNKKYDQVPWRNNKKEFDLWCQGQTGYPIVDAGMRELNTTGFMHNRVRMITSSFLTKHLLIDWRWGEAYFAEKLLDYDLASNNGGWQWAAGTGVDAAPYFRIFNPYTQAEKFDPDRKYIKKWVPEIDTSSYPEPIVEHSFARQRALDTYKAGLNRE